MTNYYYDNNITVGIWAKKSGVWTLMQDYVLAISNGPYTTGGPRTFTFSGDASFQLGSSVQAFGLTIEGVTLGTATLTGFTHAKWQAQSASGTRTATPNSELSIITVRPV